MAAEDIPTITLEMVEETNAAIAKRRAGRQEPPLKDIADAPCPECGAHAVSFVTDLVFDEMLVREQGVIPIRIPNLTGIRCSNCGDYAFDADASKKIMEAVKGAGCTPPIGVQEPPDDPRIFNRKQKDGTYRPISKFFEPPDEEQGAGA